MMVVIPLVAVVLAAAGLSEAATIGGSDRYGPKFEYDSGEDGHQFVTFNYGAGGKYKFSFKLPDQSRHEERNEDGEVRGSYSFIAPEGEEYSLQYLADKEGFQPTADHLPQPPEETEDVKTARDAFKSFYDETVKYLKALSSGEGSDGSYNPAKYGGTSASAKGNYAGDNQAFESRKLNDVEHEDDDDDDDDESSSSESDEDDDDEESDEDDDEESEESDEDDEESDEDDEESDEDDEESDEDDDDEESDEGDADENVKSNGEDENDDDDEEEKDDQKDDDNEEKKNYEEVEKSDKSKRKYYSKSKYNRGSGKFKYSRK